jgi:hypothetical protein
VHAGLSGVTHEGTRPPSHRWEENIKMYIQEKGGGGVMD